MLGKLASVRPRMTKPVTLEPVAPLATERANATFTMRIQLSRTVDMLRSQ